MPRQFAMNDKITYLSKEKYDELQAELALLTGTKRKEIAEQLEHAKSFGDLSENAEYHEAREAQANLEERIAQLEDLLQSVEIVERHASDAVEVGTTVTVRKAGTKTEKEYEIVGSEEADMKQGKISLNSPLGQSLLGKKKGETCNYITPAGKKIRIEIVAIQ